MNDTLESASAFAMNDAELMDAPAVAFVDILLHKRCDVFGQERMQIKCAVDRMFDGVVFHRAMAWHVL